MKSKGMKPSEALKKYLKRRFGVDVLTVAIVLWAVGKWMDKNTVLKEVKHDKAK